MAATAMSPRRAGPGSPRRAYKLRSVSRKQLDRAQPADGAQRTRDAGLAGARAEKEISQRARSNARRGLFFGVLLALQFGIQPIFVRKFIDRSRVDISSTVLVQEAVKLIISVLLFLVDSSVCHRSVWRSFTLKESLEFAFFPAILYAAQNLLIQSGIHHVSFITFNLLNQTKIIATAGCLYLLLGQQQSVMQMSSLVLLMIGSALLCARGPSDSVQASTELWSGIVPILAATCTSGLAGALSQMALQGRAQRNSFLYSAELAAYSLAVLCAGIALAPERRAALQERGLLAGWTRLTWVPVVANACGGICVGQVTKYAGGLRKGFAVAAGIVVTGLLERCLYASAIPGTTWVATPIIVAAMLLHARFPPRGAGAAAGGPRPKGE